MKHNIKKIAIFAGSGFLPRHVYDSCKKQGIEAKIIGLESHVSPEIFHDIDYETFPIYSVSKMLNAIKKYGITDVVLAGKVCRPAHLSKLILDAKGAKLLAKIMQYGLNDNAILTAVIKFLESEGMRLLSAEDIANDLVVPNGPLTVLEPSKEDWIDIKKGLKILKDIGHHDIGQSLVIQSGLVLGVEAAEGTDAMIERCGLIRQKEDNRPILIKAVKPEQDRRVDLPCIGSRTIHNLYMHGFKGIAIEAGVALLLEGQQTIDEANARGLFIYGI